MVVAVNGENAELSVHKRVGEQKVGLPLGTCGLVVCCVGVPTGCLRF